MSRSSSSSSSHKFLNRVILPAIKDQRTCPICLQRLAEDHRNHHLPRRPAVIPLCLHAYCFDCIRTWSQVKRTCPLCNSAFDSFLVCRTTTSRSPSYSRSQLKELVTVELSPPAEGRSDILNARSRFRYEHRRMTTLGRRSSSSSSSSGRVEFSATGCKTRPLPRLRTFAQSGSLPSDLVIERKLKWRASVYNRNLQAVPLKSRNCTGQGTSSGSCNNERIRKRIEPWIRRELQALLDDPDPSIIVHVASSLYMTSLGRNAEQLRPEDASFLAPLQPFLHDRTDSFWHELRCFAESTLTMETYDEVARYVNLDQRKRG